MKKQSVYTYAVHPSIYVKFLNRSLFPLESVEGSMNQEEQGWTTLTN